MSDPVERVNPRFTAYELDEQLLQGLPASRASAELVDPALSHELPVRDDPDVRREPFDDFENVRREEDGSAA